MRRARAMRLLIVVAESLLMCCVEIAVSVSSPKVLTCHGVGFRAMDRVERHHEAEAPRPHLHWTRTGLTPPTSAPGLGSRLATSAPGLGSPRPHLHRDWAHPSHICTGTGLTPAHICTGTGLTPAHICTGTTGSRTSRSNALAHTLHLYDAAPMRRQLLMRNRRRCVRCTSC